MRKNNWGSAFPWIASDAHSKGMTLRDYFAGQAIAGMLASAYWEQNANGNPETERAVTEQAYRMADAMLKAREENLNG